MGLREEQAAMPMGLLGQEEMPMDATPMLPDGAMSDGMAGMGQQGVPRMGTMPVGRGVGMGLPPGAEQMLMKQAIDDLLKSASPDAVEAQITGTATGVGGTGGSGIRRGGMR